ncbi:MAG: hypothetical protein HGB08_04620 [Candidatus Moranbacteria bacterium]|nr:hypothetical protein [Candidatus Moranbacteria bacterium]
MNLEGKVFGYNKKVLIGVIYTLIIIGGAFFVGAKYEKNKLSRMGLLKNKTTVSKTKKDKPKPAADSSASQPAAPATENTDAKTVQDNGKDSANSSSTESANDSAAASIQQ